MQETKWVITELEDSIYEKVVSISNLNLSFDQIPLEFDVSKSTVLRYIKRAVDSTYKRR